MENDVVFGCMMVILGAILGAFVALTLVGIYRPPVTTPAQAWVQYVEVKAEHERAYLEGLK